MMNFSSALGLPRAAQESRFGAGNRPTPPILLYHRFDPTRATSPWTVTTRVFEDQLQWLRDHRYRVVPLRPVVEALRGRGPAIGRAAVAITVDDGDRSVYTEMFPVIKRYSVPVTLFVYPSAISQSPDALTWEELRLMVQSGLVDVQFHTLSHPDFKRERRRRDKADYQAFVARELSHTRETIEERLGLTVDMLAWPYGIYNAALEKAAADAGYAVAFAVTTGLRRGNSLFAVPRICVHNRHRGARLGKRIEPADRLRAMRRARSFAISAMGFVGGWIALGVLGLRSGLRF